MIDAAGPWVVPIGANRCQSVSIGVTFKVGEKRVIDLVGAVVVLGLFVALLIGVGVLDGKM